MANAYGKYGAASRDNAQFFRAQWDRLAEKVRRYVAESEDPTNCYFLDCLNALQPAPHAGGFKIDSALGTMRNWLKDCDGFYARFPEETKAALLAETMRITKERMDQVRHEREQSKSVGSFSTDSIDKKSFNEVSRSRRKR